MLLVSGGSTIRSSDPRTVVRSPAVRGLTEQQAEGISEAVADNLLVHDLDSVEERLIEWAPLVGLGLVYAA